MAAILEPVMPDIDEPRAEAFESATEMPVVEKDSIPLESMTWPELKRVARQYDLKLNVKKSVLIRQIRETRSSLIDDVTRQHSVRGRLESVADRARQHVEQARESFAAWWTSDTPSDDHAPVDRHGGDGLSRYAKIAIWCGAIVAGGVVATIAALI